MILLDLQLTLFVLLLVTFGSLGSAWWIGRRHRRVAVSTTATVQQVCDRLTLGVVIQEPDGSVPYLNPVARRLLSLLADRTDIAAALAHFPVSPTESEHSGLLPGSVPVRWWRSVLPDRAVLLVLADWSEGQRLVREQQVFLSNLSHELRTPLTSVLAHAEILQSSASTEAVRDASVRIVKQEAQRMARLVRDLLELHRLTMGDDLPMQPVDVVLVAEDAIAQLILAAEGRGLLLSFDVGGSLQPVLAQTDRLKQVFLNLLDNAIKYCRPGDTIQVRLVAERDGVRCVVEDSGPGIPTADLPHVTERLYRVRRDVAGSGLGLALVDEILRRHYATLVIESTSTGPRTGTTVHWTLPYAHASRAFADAGT